MSCRMGALLSKSAPCNAMSAMSGTWSPKTSCISPPVRGEEMDYRSQLFEYRHACRVSGGPLRVLPICVVENMTGSPGAAEARAMLLEHPSAAVRGAARSHLAKARKAPKPKAGDRGSAPASAEAAASRPSHTHGHMRRASVEDEDMAEKEEGQEDEDKAKEEEGKEDEQRPKRQKKKRRR